MLLVLLRGGILLLWFGVGQPAGLWLTADAPTRVITDTSGYCLQLRLMVEDVARRATVPPPFGVMTLTDEGRRMCEEGEIRGGITRLRRALIMLRKAQGIGGG